MAKHHGDAQAGEDVRERRPPACLRERNGGNAGMTRVRGNGPLETSRGPASSLARSEANPRRNSRNGREFILCLSGGPRGVPTWHTLSKQTLSVTCPKN